MINYKKSKKILNIALLTVSALIVSISLLSCDPSLSTYEYDLPEANSLPDNTPPSANFSSAVSSTDHLTINFANLSSSATDFVWDFGDGNTSSAKDGQNTYADLGDYTVTLTATDKLGATDTFSKGIEVVEPAAITPVILNGNFDDGQSDWKISSFTGGTTSPYNSSSDGSPLNYDGSPSGASKTPGAKWTSGTSAGPSVSSATRYAYQSLIVTPNTEYVLIYEHAIKTDVADIAGGDRVIAEILDGHFSDGVDAVASSNAGPLAQSVGNVANGKGDFTILTKTFMSNDSGQIAIWIYAITNDELYIDNVKVILAEDL